MTTSNLSIVVQPQEFFKDKVSQAQNELKLNLNEEVEFYIVNLLCEFVFSPTLPTDEDGDCAFSTPLALVLKKALESPPEKQSGIFKKMGDTSLYVAGYFQDYFNRKSFDINYYIDMGRSAYDNLSDLMQNEFSDTHFSEIYREIALKFDDLVEVLASISDIPQTDTNDLLTIYDRWNQTKSERLRRILEANGISAVPVTKKAQ